MADNPEFDAQRAHKYFAADCFNRSWGIIDKPERDADDEEQLIHLAHASLWHWTQRPDCTDTNLSIGYWLLSRVYALVGSAAGSKQYGQRCLAKASDDDPFCQGYAHEALARAAHVAGEGEVKRHHLAEAKRLVELVNDSDNQKLLRDDLVSLE